MSPSALRRLVAATAVVAALAGLGGFAYWWTHPSLFSGIGFDLTYDRPVSVANGEVTAGILVPFEDGRGAAITVRGATANFASGSARATTTFFICTGRMIGLIATPTRPECTRVHGIPGRLDLRTNSEEALLMSVHPKSTGIVRIKSILIDYREGAGSLWRQGSETLRITLTFPAR